jgi:hypothetical protein
MTLRLVGVSRLGVEVGVSLAAHRGFLALNARVVGSEF